MPEKHAVHTEECIKQEVTNTQTVILALTSLDSLVLDAAGKR